MPHSSLSLDFATLRGGYQQGTLRPADVVDEVLRRIAVRGNDHVWIHRLSREQIAPYLHALERRDPQSAPLYGLPFAIKDNFDLAGTPTTAACPAFSYTATRTATAVARALAAGAIPIGKTNLDQFATGLVGVRSPYGTATNPFDAAMIPGGSSSGSAVAVAAGLVSFAFGTDTAGSGRVPAAFNNIVGLKPTRGLVSTSGLVPACRSLDCVSVFALTVDDSARVLAAVAAFDAADSFSRVAPSPAALPPRYRIGVPLAAQREFFGNDAGERLFLAAAERLAADGAELVDVDIEPFLAAGRLLYEGPWVAERYAAIRAFITAHPEALHNVTRSIIASGARPSAADAFAAYYRLRELRRRLEPVWLRIDALLLPTAGTSYSVRAVEADPIRLNAQLGHYTNFVNLLDLCGVAVPAGFQPDRLPFGVTLLAPAFREALVLAIAAGLHAGAQVPMGATGHPLPPADAAPERVASDDIELVVCGAHMSGLPLNHQLTSRGARLVSATRTAPVYRLVALPDGRPGMERVAQGTAIEVEVWSVPAALLGSFIAAIPPPLGIGTVLLADGSTAKGFLCESIAAASAPDITAHGGWRAYLKAKPR